MDERGSAVSDRPRPRAERRPDTGTGRRTRGQLNDHESAAVAAEETPDRVRASWYCVKGANDTYWRVDVPAKAVGARVFKIAHATGKTQIATPGLTPDRDFRWALAGDTAVYPDHEGAAVFTRPDQARATHALAMKTQGARVVAETDDNYFAPRNQNIAMRMRFDDDSARLYRNALATFDALVTTTVALRDQMWDALEKKQRRRMEFHVVGNHIDPDDWPDPVPRDGPIRVGWMGSDSHFRDVKLVYPALAWAARNGCEVVLIGYDPHWHPQCAVDGIAGLNYGDEFGFPHRQIPWVDPQQYGRDKAVYPLDIALAPLEVTAFNLGKSDVKALEYGMSGAAVVAQNMPVYQTLRHGETGFLAGSPAEFLYWTRQLVANERLRRESADALQTYIRAERLIEHHAGEWREAVTGC